MIRLTGAKQLSVDRSDVGLVRVALLTVIIKLGEILLELALVLTARRLVLSILALLAGDGQVQPLDLLLEKLLALLVRLICCLPIRQSRLLLFTVHLLKRLDVLLKALIFDLDGVHLVV